MNTNQNHTDNFFKQALNSAPDLSPSGENWKAMEHLLNQESKRRPVRWLYLASAIAAALLLFVSFWLVPQKSPDESLNTSSESGSKTKNSPIETNSQHGLAVKENTAPENRTRPVSGTAMNRDHADRGIIASAAPAPNRVTGNSPVIVMSDRDLLTAAAYTGIRSSGFDLQALNEKINGEPGHYDQPPVKSDSKISREKNQSGRLSLSLAFSPDVNSVKGAGSGDIGMSFGGGLSYRLGKNISVGTGIYYAQKMYSATKDSYHAKEKPFSTWTSYSTRIDADCRVIDIPLNLNFRIKSGKETNLYATAGLSSYIMLSEKYNFIYTPTPAYPSKGREYTIRNQNKHALSVINLGFALEKPLSDQVSLAIQPYAKLPLTGIGQGHTDLKSFGVGFKLNYALKKFNKLTPAEKMR